MTLYGEGEPQPTLLQQATQAVKIELYTQWQTYRNGVHMDRDTFDSIDFRALAVAALTGAGFEVKALDVTLQLPILGDDLNATAGPPVMLPEHRTIQGIRDRNVRPEVTLAGTTTQRDAEFSGKEHVEARVAQVRVRRASDAYNLDEDAIAEHGKQVQG